ncbi:MAG TPA: Fe-S cluster assembly ATPase SufC [Chloroflexus aurantiacus]|jgi:Fe-S cluster assembly ATP-binding protein|uniref:FeS assembly ATPase SufC n=1 Tax=Chloroflexus aurantiacus (strain ATCC 29366 / DSM 635 / J-10-fl) TaxID=324602 RepID=A9WKN7_CHLAA|nr:MULTISPECIES: Fe-S cluster assembly ATPase SufC [Chloroflexus]ABY36665.1 FeS assembly ATPase SufC [Chloroflexus aurantiacus J-10-fl]RMG53194.1 MAG: Fe-S cluster assembly ATPase SufC [Chloroflexota bacterium]GIV94448.1 MAG: ABC transporter ATP-binding protein [Chloroflexus sp.]HBW67683.1 Fe-S cluster assembly ATPase SufC [Chloroflexus aurantiacus]
MSNDLIIKDLYARIGDKEILRGVNLTVRQGTVHAIMGPNGSGKSTLSYIIAGHPSYEVTGGEIWYKGHNLLELEPDERSRLGVFLAFQYPVAVPGVTVANFLRSAINAHRAEEGKDPKETAIPAAEFRKLLREGLNLLDMDESFARRYLNDGFSGGEKKRLEILQMMLLKPTMAVLDETDSGLDIDALRIVANGVNRLAGPHMGVLVITHYQRLLNYIKPDVVSVMMDGRIVREGGPELALELEEKGYDWLREELTGAA